jgi:biopolymer transport protein ExbD
MKITSLAHKKSRIEIIPLIDIIFFCRFLHDGSLSMTLQSIKWICPPPFRLNAAAAGIFNISVDKIGDVMGKEHKTLPSSTAF